jgi:hypothetical protein
MRFGLQDKDLEIDVGREQPDGSRIYEVEAPVIRDANSGAPRFRGPFVHGPPSERFLYLTEMHEELGNWRIKRRLKIQLRTITWEQIEAARARPGAALLASVEGTKSGTVPLLGNGWSMSDAESR